MADTQAALKKELVKQLKGGNAHAKFDDVAAEMPKALRGTKVQGLPYSAWQLLEHIRIAQRDMLDFCRNENGKYKALKWPDDYWPKDPEPNEDKAWDDSVKQVKKDLDEFVALVEDEKSDLFKKFEWGEGQTLLHEALLVVDHVGYHLGELVAVRRILGSWPVKKS